MIRSSHRALAIVLPRVIAASILLRLMSTRTRVASGILPPVVAVHVGHGPAVSRGQDTATGHLRVVRREGAGLGVRLAGGAVECRLQRVIGQTERRSSLAADGIRLTIGHSIESLKLGLTLCGEDRYRPFHVSV